MDTSPESLSDARVRVPDDADVADVAAVGEEGVQGVLLHVEGQVAHKHGLLGVVALGTVAVVVVSLGDGVNSDDVLADGGAVELRGRLHGCRAIREANKRGDIRPEINAM